MTPVNPAASELGKVNAILRGVGRQHHVRDFPGPLSVKAVMRGVVLWKTERREFWVDETSFLVLNDGQAYSIELESREPVTTCCVFFERGFVESVHRSVTMPAERLLPEPDRGLAIEFETQLHTQEDRVLQRIRGLNDRVAAGCAESLWLENQVLLLARDLVEVHREAARQVRLVPAARAATREEIYRRLSRAREYMHEHQDRRISLAEVARAACLSPYHFHRLFCATFRTTPHEYLTRERLERARRLLADEDLPVTEVSLRAGFESLGSFSALFRRRCGVSPREFRRLQRK